MKAAKVSDIKKDLKNKPQPELLELCLRLAKFKKENKELLTYLLYEADDEAAFIQSIKEEVDEQFDEINTSSYYFIKIASTIPQKTIFKILIRVSNS